MAQEWRKLIPGEFWRVSVDEDMGAEDEWEAEQPRLNHPQLVMVA